MPAPQGYLIPEFNHSPHIIPAATSTTFGSMSPAQAAAVASLPSQPMISLGGKVQTSNNTPTLIASAVLPALKPGAYLLQFQAAAAQDDVLAVAYWASSSISSTVAVLAVQANGVAIILAFPPLPSQQAFQTGGTSAAWAISASLTGNTLSLFVAGDPTRIVNWQLNATILASQ